MGAKRSCAVSAALALAMALGLALGHTTPAKAARPTEAQLRAMEERLLGAAHAAEHARARRAARRGRKVRDRHGIGRGTKRVARGGVRARKANSAVGLWQSPIPVPGVAITAALLPTGKVMYFDDVKNSVLPEDERNSARAHIWDPTRPIRDGVNPKLVNPPSDARGRPTNIWCSGISYLPDGRLLITGGNLGYTAEDGYLGLPTVFTFDPFTEKWARHEDMQHGRWYPGQLMMPDGRTVIMSGDDENGGDNNQIELFDPRTNDVSVVGLRGGQGEPPMGEQYPRMFVMPDGRGLVAGPGSGDSFYLWLTGSTFGWTNAPNPKYRTYGTSVLLPGGVNGSTKVMAMGGGTSGVMSATTETYDSATPNTAWKAGHSLNQARGHHNAVTLPDGSMVVIGGGYGSGAAYSDGQYAAGEEHKPIEIYDPSSKTFAPGPAQLENRAYHSTAVLLPDGRVMSGGDDRPDHKERDTFEIYEPPYLHKGGERPAISSAPEGVEYREAFSVATSGPGARRAVLMAPASTTHGFDSNQRHVELQLTPAAGGVDLVAPPNANVAPPGWYMLFVLDDRGVPSVAKWIKVGSGSIGAIPPLTAAGTPTANGSVPSAAPPGSTAPVTHPAPSASVERPARLRTALRRGLGVRVRCTGGCTVNATLRLAPSTARGLRRPAMVGRARLRIGSTGSGRLVLRPDASVRGRLSRLRRLSLVVETMVSVPGGGTRRISRTVLLRR